MAIPGFILLFVCVFGVFILHGGSMDVIAHAAPAELATILGAGIAAMLVGNDLDTIKGVAGGNLLICGTTQDTALDATDAAVKAMRQVPDAIMPFPGGIVRAGSKVGSIYKKLKASTNDAYCPTLQTQTKSELPDGTGAVYEIVIDGLSFDAVKASMKAGLHAAASCPGVTLITAGNYGGKLGPRPDFPNVPVLANQSQLEWSIRDAYAKLGADVTSVMFAAFADPAELEMESIDSGKLVEDLEKEGLDNKAFQEEKSNKEIEEE